MRRHRAGALLLAGGATILCLLVLFARGELGLVSGLAIAAAAAAGALAARLRSQSASVQDGPAASVALSPLSILPDPAVLVDARAIVTDVNEAARALFPALQPNKPLSFGIRDPRLLSAVPQVAGDGEPCTIEIGGHPAEPTYEVRLRSLDPARSPVSGVALFFRDRSAERRTETMRIDFVANVSHELRTPLASLIGFIDTLLGPARNDPAARERFLPIMQGQAGRMKRLIDDLLQLSRVELNQHRAPSDPVDLTTAAAHILELAAPAARDRNVELAFEAPDGELRVPGDRDELLRVVENLVENAIKYGGEGGRVSVVVARRSPGRVELSVRDAGPGIGPEHLPRLTERFYRVDVAESRQQGGTGLGLAIVKHIVQRHRGRLAIDSEPGRGTLVRAELPEHGG